MRPQISQIAEDEGVKKKQASLSKSGKEAIESRIVDV
jgi:hypothetical protein